ncbi:MAG: CDGSH iron-sulfur domain-containing protein [Halocynthiibacter sp.]
MSDDIPGEAKPIIETRENGPLVAKNLSSMKGHDGAEITLKASQALCRCGHSNNKPFCDGSHRKVEFKSAGGTPAGRDRRISYEGSEATITYNPMLCSHATQCSQLAGHIFNPDQKPWIQPDKGTRQEIEAVVAACPSGALALAGPEHLFAERAQIEIEKNGPLWVSGVPIDAEAAGEGASPDKYVLCRCGLSGNKPYCDGSHRDKGWKSND